MKIGILIISLALSLVHPLRADATFEDLFHLSTTEAENSLGQERLTILQAALDDFNAVINFKPPVHAQIDKQAALPADGGTSFFKGNGYSLTVTKSLFNLRGPSQGGIIGFLYGPGLTFNANIGIGNSQTISRISFYPAETLNRLLKQ